MSETERVRHLSTDGVTVETAAVSLKVVRVGKKQMTLSVFRQIPERYIVSGFAVDDDTGHFELNPEGKIWGLVRYFWEPPPDYRNRKGYSVGFCGRPWREKVQLLYENRGCLYRCLVAPAEVRRYTEAEVGRYGNFIAFRGDPKATELLARVYDDLEDSALDDFVAAWNEWFSSDVLPSDQLFIAV